MTDRLTKNELTWLLTQEARTASQKLRQGVSVSIQMGDPTIPPPPPAAAGTSTIVIEEGGAGANVEGTLNQLDHAVTMLASLHGHPQARGRRGKIDLAALLWEVAPEARVQIEMGEGTTVFGDEGELRRMLHVLIGQAGDPLQAKSTQGISLRREGDEVQLGVPLGPDASSSFHSERAWLSRMATRYGGRLELDGSMQRLILAADVDNQRRELENLKKELAAAQAQGEAYARELATLFTREFAIPAPPPLPSSISTTPHASRMPAGSDGLAVLVAAVRVLGADLRGILSSIGRDVAPLRDREGDVGEMAASVGRHVTGASELVGDLSRLGACPIGELPRQADVAELLREVVRGDQGRATRHEVRVTVDAPENAEELVPAAGLSVLLHLLVDHAIHASPPGTEVVITLSDERTDEGGAISIFFDDAGPPLPPHARGGVLSRDFEAIAHGRPRALSLIAAYAVAAHLGCSLEFDDGPRGGARVRVTLAHLGS